MDWPSEMFGMSEIYWSQCQMIAGTVTARVPTHLHHCWCMTSYATTAGGEWVGGSKSPLSFLHSWTNSASSCSQRKETETHQALAFSLFLFLYFSSLYCNSSLYRLQMLLSSWEGDSIIMLVLVLVVEGVLSGGGEINDYR